MSFVRFLEAATSHPMVNERSAGVRMITVGVIQTGSVVNAVLLK